MRQQTYIIDGSSDLVLQNAKGHLLAAMADAKGARRAYAVNIKRHVKKRSTDQNARYWAILGEISDWVNEYYGSGLTPEDVHNNMKARILGMRATPIGVVPKSTTDLTTPSFSEYCDKVQAVAATEWGVVFEVG